MFFLNYYLILICCFINLYLKFLWTSPTRHTAWDTSYIWACAASELNSDAAQATVIRPGPVYLLFIYLFFFFFLGGGLYFKTKMWIVWIEIVFRLEFRFLENHLALLYHVNEHSVNLWTGEMLTLHCREFYAKVFSSNTDEQTACSKLVFLSRRTRLFGQFDGILCPILRFSGRGCRWHW